MPLQETITRERTSTFSKRADLPKIDLPPNYQPKILVVDDQLDVSYAITEMIKFMRPGFKVDEWYNRGNRRTNIPDDISNLLLEDIARADVAIIDWHLQLNSSGVDLVRETLHSEKLTKPSILMITGDRDTGKLVSELAQAGIHSTRTHEEYTDSNNHQPLVPVWRKPIEDYDLFIWYIDHLALTTRQRNSYGQTPPVR